MSFTVVLLILVSAVFHVSWNMLGKSRTPSAAFFLGTSLSVVILLFPVFIFIVPPFLLPARIWMFLIPAGIFQSIYYVGLGGGYLDGDMSFVYPLARALPVLFIPVISVLLKFGTRIDSISLFGMMFVFSGCLLLPLEDLKRFSFKNYFSWSARYAVIAALGTTGYTIVDSEGMKYLSEVMKLQFPDRTGWTAVIYIAYEMLLTFTFSAIYVAARKKERKNFVLIIKESKLYIFSAGLIIFIAYGIILMAYPMVTNVSYITAFRQISIPLGALSGILILKEKVSAGKIAGAFVIFLGLVLVYL